jgi:alkylation response protein AidB-like acyl-CoA dehydrogenase
MDLNDTPAQAELRARVRAWIERNMVQAPPAQPVGQEDNLVAHRRWQRSLAESGWAGVTWPVEYGGAGLGQDAEFVVNQELETAGLPGVFDTIGVGVLGPTIITHGTEAQKQRHLAPLLQGDEVWCQMFSEPAAGSDLAGIRTRAVRDDGGGWRVSGQKLWTTNAHVATFGMLIARTNPRLPKHQGLTMFVLPLDAPGVTVRPLRQGTGVARFSEVFLDDVRLGEDADLGGVDCGWRVAMTVLTFERYVLGSRTESQQFRTEIFAEALAAVPEATRDSEVLRRFGEVATEFCALRFSHYRQLTALGRREGPGAKAALSKITSVNAAVAATDLVLEVLGPEALATPEWAQMTLFLPGLKSAGGTEQILRNMIGERELGLPGEPRVDKNVPFSELGRGGQAQ